MSLFTLATVSRILYSPIFMSFISEFFIVNLSLIKIQIFVDDLWVYTKWSCRSGKFSVGVLFLMARTLFS